MRRVSASEILRKGGTLKGKARETKPIEREVPPPVVPALDAEALAGALSKLIEPMVQRDATQTNLLVELLKSQRNTEEDEAPPELIGDVEMVVHRNQNTDLISMITIGDKVIQVKRSKQTGFIMGLVGEDTTAVVNRDPKTGKIMSITVSHEEPILN